MATITKKPTKRKKLANNPVIRFSDENLLFIEPQLVPQAGSKAKKAAKASEIKLPIDISEQSGISGFMVGKRFKNYTGLKELNITKPMAKAKTLHKYAHLAAQLASDGDGAPAVGTNYIKIWIDEANANAGSNADYIWMYFGKNKKIKLWGVDRTRFPKGWWLQWDLNNVSPPGYIETIPTDAWDEITLVNNSGDGMKLDRIQIVHSDVTILDWNANVWLDGSKLETHGRVSLTAPMLEEKLDMIGHEWIPQVHWAARELGKTDGTKYGSTGAWCSEFASWCLRKELWNTPTGNIGSTVMENYFNGIGRKYTKTDILNGTYKMSKGDYVRFEWSPGSHHSAIFLEYVTDANSPSNATRIKTIDGNTGGRVAIRERTLVDVLSVGCTR